MKKYTAVFLDLDDTLLDFSKSEASAIKKTLEKFSLPCNEEQIALYSKINYSYWRRFEKGEILKNDIFISRFKEFLSELESREDPERVNNYYFEMLSHEHPFVEGAKWLLDKLKLSGIKICITTNGASRTQFKRLYDSGISAIADYIIVSEDIGFQKPQKEYFEYALKLCGENRKDVLVVGDSQSSDVLGALNAELDCCWYNPKNKEKLYESKYEIKKLSQLCEILNI